MLLFDVEWGRCIFVIFEGEGVSFFFSSFFLLFFFFLFPHFLLLFFFFPFLFFPSFFPFFVWRNRNMQKSFVCKRARSWHGRVLWNHRTQRVELNIGSITTVSLRIRFYIAHATKKSVLTASS
jgi:hypothetical protein